jgi:aspartyl-tRNA(Asn)/glutamyl-tRNA(Gln) amidotransferase subunit B
MSGWEPVIGLEIHVQLKTRTKMFCACENGPGGGENTQTCPVCLGHPGALPVPNVAAIEKTILLGHALGCEIAPRALFHRKNYFYPDLPKGYQISQYDVPLCAGGTLSVPMPDGDLEVGIVRAHLEEDAAKNVHVGGKEGRISNATATLVDYNRGGTPLVEIVTEPHIHSSEEAKRFLQLLRQTVVELGLSDAELDKGSMRFDVNVSIRPEGSDELRTRTELKNMNSFNFAAKGIEREIARQIGIYESGGTVDQETLHFDPSHESAPPLRSKEEAEDYRYFPEPDLVPVEPPAEMVERLRAGVRELPGARIVRLRADVGDYNASVLVTGGFDFAYAALVREGVPATTAANWLTNEFAATGANPSEIAISEIAKVLLVKDEIPRAALLEATSSSVSSTFSSAPFTQTRSVSDVAELDPVIDRIIEANPGQVAAFKGGKEGLLGFFVGQVMKETGGKANARVVNERVREKLSA